MISHKRWWLAIVAGWAWLCSASAHAECGGLQECIAISSDPAVAPAHSADGVNTPAPAIDFGNQVAATASATRTILVAAVAGPAGTRATIIRIRPLTGANASDFEIVAGGTCTDGSTLLHDGAQVAQIANSCTILVRFKPQSVGVKNAQVNVVSASITRIAPLTGTGTPSLTGPGASAANMEVAVNTATTADLAAFTSGVVTGIAIVTAPSHGTASVSGTRVTYTPARDYFGPDSFTYAAFNAAGSSAPAPVTVNVSGRPDPSKDPNVIGLVDAQQRTARRFGSTQISNYQRRMEGLHRSAAGGSRAATGSGRGGVVEAVKESGSVSSMSQHTPAEPAVLVASNTRAAENPAGATGLLGPFLSAADGRIDPASAADGGRGARRITDDAGIWVSGTLGFGRRNAQGDVRGLRFETDGVTIGADRRLSDRLAVGIGAGYARDKTTIGTDGSDTRAEGASAAVYGSYQPTRDTFIDALIGYGTLRHRSDRFVPAFNDVAHMRRRSDQVFGSIAGGYELQAAGVLIAPYGRIDIVHDRFKQAAESGAGPSALTYFEQSETSVQAAIGVRAESRHETSFGYARPRLRVELRHDFDDRRDARIAYADLPAGPVFSMSLPDANRNTLLLGAGSDFELHNGITLGVDYQTERASGLDRNHMLRVWLRKDLDGKPLPAAQTGGTLYADPVRIEAGYMWDDNVTRAPDANFKLSDHVYSLGATKSTAIPLGTHTRVLLAGFVNGETYYTYNGLDRVGAGARAELQYRTSAAFDAPTFGVFARSGYDEYSSALRRGWRHAIGLTARQAWTDRIGAFAAYTHAKREAENEVFDGKDWSARAHIDFSFGSAGLVYIGGEYRRGDIVATSGPPGLGYGGYAKAVVQDDAYADNTQLFAYRLEAKTIIWTLGYNLPLGARDALDFSWRRAESTSLQSPVPGGTGFGSGDTPRYTVDQLSVVYLMRF